MAAAALASSTFNIENVNIHLKRSKNETDLIKAELERMHQYVINQQEVPWAKTRIETMQDLLLAPDAKSIRESIKNRALKEIELASDNSPTRPLPSTDED